MQPPLRPKPDTTGWAAHEWLVGPARDRAEPWRLAVGLVLIICIGIALNTALAVVLRGVAPGFWIREIATASSPGQTPAALIILLGTFGFFTFGTVVVVQMLHGRAPLSLIGPLGATWAQFKAVLAMLLVLGFVLALLPPYATSLAPKQNLAFSRWLALLPVGLVVLFIQISAEEILFRGYLQSQLAARFQSPWIWIGLPSLLFAAGHYVPDEAGENALLIALWALAFGALMADLTARAGTLGPALAVHFVNNITAVLFITVTDGMSGLALYASPEAAADPALVRAWMPVDFAAMVVSWLAARVALRR